MITEPRTGSMVGKTVLVTGGTGGIGKATALGLARRGARRGVADEVRRRYSRLDVRWPATSAE